MTKKKIYKHDGASSEYVDDLLAVEKRLRISVNGKEAISLYCTPHMIRELVAGLVMTEGIIRGSWCADTMAIEYGDEIFVDIPAEGDISTEGRTITSGCAGGVSFGEKSGIEAIKDEFVIDKDTLRNIFNEFQAMSELHKLTGCIHSAALSDGNSILCFAEDIGRHNAVDKVIGYALLEDIPFSGKILLASGRVSSEISSKCSRWGIPILASRTAPTSLAVDIAERSGVTIAGFIRGKRLNVYTHPERITKASV